MLDGRLVLTSQPKKHKRQLEDIVSWCEAFSIYTLALTSTFPNRWRDLLQYKLLILRTYRQFSGRAWLEYDQAFRQFTSASNLTDWSKLNPELYNFHTAGSSARLHSNNICKSWNRGRRTSPHSPCRYPHKCSKCSGAHKAVDCKVEDARTSERSDVKRPGSPNVHSSKYRKY